MSIKQAVAHVAGNRERLGTPHEKMEAMMIQDSGNIASRGVGKAKNNLTEALDEFNKASATIFDASDVLHAQMDSLSRKTKDAVSRAKDSAVQMTDAMNRVTKVLGSDFDGRLTQLQTLTECMERLANLNKNGKLAEILQVIGK